MPFTYSAEIQDDIALLLGRSSYSNLTVQQKKAIDGNSTASPPTKGAALRASNILTQYANVWDGSDKSFSSLPTEWQAWFVHETARLASPAFPTAEGPALREAADRARVETLSSYAATTFSTTDVGVVGALDVQSLRKFAGANAIRANDAVALDPSSIDAAIEEVVSEVWNDADWSFKQVVATLTIGTDSSVTVTDSLVLDKLLDDRILYTGQSGGFAVNVDWQTILDHLSSSNQTAGQPTMFHLKTTGSGLGWTFERTPDKEYTAKGSFTVAAPSMSDLATMNSALAQFPPDFRPIIKKRVLAVALTYVGRVTVPAQIMEETTQKLAALLPRYDKTAREPENSAYENYRPMGLGANIGHVGGHSL